MKGMFHVKHPFHKKAEGICTFGFCFFWLAKRKEGVKKCFFTPRH